MRLVRALGPRPIIPPDSARGSGPIASSIHALMKAECVNEWNRIAAWRGLFASGATPWGGFVFFPFAMGHHFAGARSVFSHDRDPVGITSIIHLAGCSRSRRTTRLKLEGPGPAGRAVWYRGFAGPLAVFLSSVGLAKLAARSMAAIIWPRQPLGAASWALVASGEVRPARATLAPFFFSAVALLGFLAGGDQGAVPRACRRPEPALATCWCFLARVSWFHLFAGRGRFSRRGVRPCAYQRLTCMLAPCRPFLGLTTIALPRRLRFSTPSAGGRESVGLATRVYHRHRFPCSGRVVVNAGAQQAGPARVMNGMLFHPTSVRSTVFRDQDRAMDTTSNRSSRRLSPVIRAPDREPIVGRPDKRAAAPQLSARRPVGVPASGAGPAWAKNRRACGVSCGLLGGLARSTDGRN